MAFSKRNDKIGRYAAELTVNCAFARLGRIYDMIEEVSATGSKRASELKELADKASKIQADFNMPENEKGSYTDIIINAEVYGRALRTRKDVKPIFVSCGNNIDLKTSTEIVLNLINNESRLPIPIRLADLETHISRRELS